MPVRRMGLSEYKRNFTWRKSDPSRLCSPTREQKCECAGLRSDEFGISREPSFISKRKVPQYNTQFAQVFEWNGDNDWKKEAPSECDGNQPTQPLEWHPNHDKDDINQGKSNTPDAPRLPDKLHSSPACSRSESPVAPAESKKPPSKIEVHENRLLASMKEDLGKIDNGLNRVLQRKAGMNVSRLSNFPRSSEYQSEFVWKTPPKLSPVLAADKFIHSASQTVPPFKCLVTIPETEYERSFKVSPPVKELKQKCYSEERRYPVSEPVEISPGEKNEKKETFSKTTEDLSKQGMLEAKQNQHKRKHKPLCLHRRFRKMNTEYRSKFLSPAQYMYKDGAWLRIKKNAPGQVKELREKAEAYRQRIWGTHFSRDHLNQLLSDNNRLWDLSSESSAEEAISHNIRALDLAGVPEKPISPGPKALPQSKCSQQQLQQNNTEKLGMSDASTLPVRRRLVWGEPANADQMEIQPPALEEGEEKENKQELEEEEEKVDASDKDAASAENDQEENVNSRIDMADSSSSVPSRKGGRVPTPRLRAHGGGQRTHHDLTTPAAGGAVLVSPPKVKSSSSRTLSYNQISREDLKRKSNGDEGEAPAAGLKTFDPLPVRKDQRPSLASSDAKTPPSSVLSEQTESAKDPTAPYWSPSCRIQGTLRDPEFQHNGSVASPPKSWLQLPLQERNYDDDDDDDRLSQLSARSAASSSFASQVLERAQRRKENFWGKM